MARKLRTSVTLIHAVEPYATEAENVDLENEARRRLAPLAEAVRASGVTVEIEIVRGYAEESIAAAAKRIDALLLFMGTHGRRAPLRWLLGSVAERTLQSSEVPVLVMEGGSGAFTAWADGEQPLRATFALECAVPAKPLLEIARLFHGAGGCELRFIHVAPRALLAGQLPTLLEQTAHASLAELGASVELIPNGESLSGAIASFVKAHSCDLTVVGNHPRWEFDFSRPAEVARALLHHRIGPVVGVPLAPRSARTQQAPTFDSILVPTDLLELGNRAVDHAYALSRGGSLTLLYVYLTPGGIAVPLDSQQRQELERRLASLVPSDAAARGVSTNILIVEGERPAQAIVDTATRLGCNIICMGAHGRSTLGRVVLGSVADEVLHRFPKPVLIVR